MSNVIPFPTPEMVVVERVMCRGVDEPPSALRPMYWLTYHDEDGGKNVVWDGLTYIGALYAAVDWDLSGIRIVDRVVPRSCGDA